MTKHQIRPALTMLAIMTVLTGLLYPLVITGVAQLLFPHQANGSLILRNGQIIGSELIGQYFNDPKYFWGRPSATSPFPYNAAASGGSNLAPTNPVLIDRVKATIADLGPIETETNVPVPVDLVTASGSGLDPHISPAAARYQLKRVALARGLDDTAIQILIEQHTEDRQLRLLGEPRVNVLQLNLALDSLP
jgi:K+-transporting ATPase ATPase C chain